MKPALQELRDIDPSSPAYPSLIARITSNFDKLHDDGNLWCASRAVSRKDKDHEFIGYTFKRKKVPKFMFQIHVPNTLYLSVIASFKQLIRSPLLFFSRMLCVQRSQPRCLAWGRGLQDLLAPQRRGLTAAATIL
jgi:hypothetical protein